MCVLSSLGLFLASRSNRSSYYQQQDDEHIPAFHQSLAGNIFSSLPMALLNNDVCRDDLLFEIEVDAVQ